MKSDINPNILQKIRSSSQPKNMQDFLEEILELEYEKLDESNPKLKGAYVKLIKEYK